MTVVTITLNCGHKRTWNQDCDWKVYGHKDKATCKDCGRDEYILSSIKKKVEQE